MRHGDAALDAASDSVRPLTTNGCDESRLMANWLKGQKVEIERVLVSPFLRDEQTLEEVGDCLNLPSSAEVLPELTPCGDVGLVGTRGRSGRFGFQIAASVSACAAVRGSDRDRFLGRFFKPAVARRRVGAKRNRSPCEQPDCLPIER